MIKNFTHLFSRIDIFGSSVQLSFQKHSEYKSGLGGVFSIFLIFLMTLFFWSNKTFSEDPSVVDLDDNNFMFAITFDQKEFLTNPYFNISLTQNLIKTHENGTKEFLSYPRILEPCKYHHFDNLPSYNVNWTLIFDQNNLKEYLCLSKDETFKIGGDYTQDNFYFLQFAIQDCINDSDSEKVWKPKCKTKDEVDKYLKDSVSKICLYFPTIMVNPDDPSDDFMKSYLNTDTFFYFQPKKLYKTADIFFTEYTIDTDTSILPTESLTNLQFPIYETKDYREQQVLGTFNNNYADFYIRRSYFTTVIDRSYTKLDEVISYIGGFLEAFLIFLAIFLHYYNECLYSVALANKLYDFEVGQPQNPNNTPSKKSPSSKSKISKQETNNDNNFKNKLLNNLQKGSESSKNKDNSKQNSPSRNNTSIFGKQDYSNHKLGRKIRKYSNNLQISEKRFGIDDHSKNFPINENDDSEVLYRKKLFNICQRRQSIKPRSINSIKVQRMQYMKKVAQQKNYSFEDQLSDASENISDKEKDDVQINSSKGKEKNKQVLVKKKIRRSVYMPNRKNNQSALSQSIMQSNNKIDISQYQDQTAQNFNYLQTPCILSPLASTSNKINITDRRIFLTPKGSLFSPTQFGAFNAKLGQQNITQQDENPFIQTNQQDPIFSFPKQQVENNEIKNTTKLLNNHIILQIPRINIEVSQKMESQKKIDIDQNNDCKVEQYNQTQNTEGNDQNLNTEGNDQNLKTEGNDQNQDDQDKKDKSKKIIADRVFQLKQSVDRLQYLKTEFKALLNRSNQIKMTFSYVIYKLSCGKLCKTKNNLLIEKSRELLSEELDIFVILEKLKEVKKFKELFLDKEQQTLFNFFPKPVIKIEEENEFQISKGSLLELHANTPNNNNKNNNVKNTGGISPNAKNLKAIGIFAQAIHKLKQGVKTKHHVPSTMDAYKKLYDCYIICSKDKNLINKKLINMLGREINGIFKKSSNVSGKQQSQSASDNKQNGRFNFLEKSDHIIEGGDENKNLQKSRQQSQAKIDILDNEVKNLNQQDINNVDDKIKHVKNKNIQKENYFVDETNIQLEFETNKNDLYLQNQPSQDNDDLLKTQQREYQGLFAQSGFLRNKIESTDIYKDTFTTLETQFSQRTKNNDFILNSALRKRDLNEKDSKKKITFKKSNSLKGNGEDDEEEDNREINFKNEYEYFQPIYTQKTETFEEDDAIIKKLSSRIMNLDTQQDTNRTDTCQASRLGYIFSNTSNNYPRNESITKSPLLTQEDFPIQTQARKSSYFGNNLSINQGQSPILKLQSNKSISDIEAQQLQFELESYKSSDKISERSNINNRKKSATMQSKFKKSSKISFYEQETSNYYKETNNDIEQQNNKQLNFEKIDKRNQS